MSDVLKIIDMLTTYYDPTWPIGPPADAKLQVRWIIHSLMFHFQASVS